jgi:hypothetical protein
VVNEDLVADLATSAALGNIAMSDSGGFMDAEIAAPHVVEVPNPEVREPVGYLGNRLHGTHPLGSGATLEDNPIPRILAVSWRTSDRRLLLSLSELARSGSHHDLVMW